MSSQQEKTKPKINVNLQKQTSLNQQYTKTMGKSASVIKRELKRILPKINREQRQDIAQQFLKQLGKKGIEKPFLQQQLSLSTVDPKQMNSEDISEVAIYAYQHYPDLFQSILTQRNLVQFLSNPILSAIVGIMAAKWLN
jgi:ribosomal protein L28